MKIMSIKMKSSIKMKQVNIAHIWNIMADYKDINRTYCGFTTEISLLTY